MSIASDKDADSAVRKIEPLIPFGHLKIVVAPRKEKLDRYIMILANFCGSEIDQECRVVVVNCTSTFCVSDSVGSGVRQTSLTLSFESGVASLRNALAANSDTIHVLFSGVCMCRGRLLDDMIGCRKKMENTEGPFVDSSISKN